MGDFRRPDNSNCKIESAEYSEEFGSESMCSKLLQSFPTAICIINNNGWIASSNKLFVDLLGDWCIDDCFYDLLDESQLAFFRSRIEKLQSGSLSTSQIIIDFVSSRGEYIRVDCIVSPFSCETLTGFYLCQLKDRSIDLQLETSFQRTYNRLQVLTEGIPDILLELSPSGTIVFANRSGLHKTKSELQGASVLEILPSNLHEEWSNIYNRKKDTKFHFKLDESGTIEHLQAFVKFVKNEDDGVFAVLMISDVTESVNKTEELQAHKLMLQQSIEAKDKFLSIMAHDLKAPFNALISFGQLLLDTMHDGRYDKAERLINLINESALHSYNLIENLLTWSRAQQGELTASPVNFSIHEAITDTYELLYSVALGKSITCICESKEPIHVFADYNMIKTVLRNLISNAIKFTHKGGTVYAGYSLRESFVDVYIRDEGTGMMKDVQDSLFKDQKPKSQIGTNKEKGTGLGLLVCKEFIGKNNGVISVSSEFGNGSEFKFTLPIH